MTPMGRRGQEDLAAPQPAAAPARAAGRGGDRGGAARGELPAGLHGRGGQHGQLHGAGQEPGAVPVPLLRAAAQRGPPPAPPPQHFGDLQRRQPRRVRPPPPARRALRVAPAGLGASSSPAALAPSASWSRLRSTESPRRTLPAGRGSSRRRGTVLPVGLRGSPRGGWGSARSTGSRPARALTPRPPVPSPAARVLRALGGEMAVRECPWLRREEATQRGGERAAVPPPPPRLGAGRLRAAAGAARGPASPPRTGEGAQERQRDLGCRSHPSPVPK